MVRRRITHRCSRRLTRCPFLLPQIRSSPQTRLSSGVGHQVQQRGSIELDEAGNLEEKAVKRKFNGCGSFIAFLFVFLVSTGADAGTLTCGLKKVTLSGN